MASAPTLNSSASSTSLVRNLIDTIESNTVLSPLQLNSENTTNTTANLKSSTKYSSSIISNGTTNNPNHSTDTDDAKILSSRVRSNSSNQETSFHLNNKSNSEYLILNPGKHLPTSNSSSQILNTNNFNIYNSVYSSNYGNSTNTNKNRDIDNSSANSTAWAQNSNNANNANSCNSDALANLVKKYGVSKRNALMKWCQERMSSYKGIEIKNFSSSWNDGLAFCALLHSYIPQKLDYETLRQENNPVC